MKAIILVLAAITIGSHLILADGFPFDPSTQQVTVDTVRIRLTETQVDILSATGLVTLSDTQLSLIHPFYPKASNVQAVISATYNDNHEGLTDEDVHIFWVAAKEIAVTLNQEVIASKTLRESALTESAVPQPSDIRIAPNGRVYLDGKGASREEAFALISIRSKEPEGFVTVCVGPPFHASFSEFKDPAGQFQDSSILEQSVADIYNALRTYGESQNVSVNKCW